MRPGSSVQNKNNNRKIENAIHELQPRDSLARRGLWIDRLHPLAKLFVTVTYIALSVSFHKYDLGNLILMAVYPFFLFQLADLRLRDALRRLRIVLPLVMIIGIFNPFFDRTVLFRIGGSIGTGGTAGQVSGGIAVTGGILSMLTLMLKGCFAVLSSYILIATTTIESLCGALRRIHVPQIIVVEIMLIYRYITVLLREAERASSAYALRAPGQRGIAFRAWGPFLGRLLIRSMDRADVLYQSMCVRGFRGEFHWDGAGLRAKELLYAAGWILLFILLRFGHVAARIGSLIM